MCLIWLPLPKTWIPLVPIPIVVFRTISNSNLFNRTVITSNLCCVLYTIYTFYISMWFLCIHMGAYFLSNLLHSNARKYTSSVLSWSDSTIPISVVVLQEYFCRASQGYLQTTCHNVYLVLSSFSVDNKLFCVASLIQQSNLF